MKLFGRKRTTSSGDIETTERTENPETTGGDESARETGNDPTPVDATTDAAVPDDGGPEVPVDGGSSAATGPLDAAEVDGLGGRVDLGGIWLPARQGMELRLEVEEKTKRVIAATIAIDGSSVQLQAFAAPRSGGLWDEVRAEIAESVAQQGGSADDVPGTFGRELLARLPGRTPDGRTGHQPARFVGFDGPRWFLRAVFTGRAASEADQAAVLEDLVRGTVVVRGQEAMAPREMLPLTLPPTGRAAAPQSGGAGGPDVTEEADGGTTDGGATNGGATNGGAPARDDDPLRPFERGPEITETR